MADQKKVRKSNPLPKDPVERFKAVANRRGGNVIRGIRSLHVLAKQHGTRDGQYQYSDADATKLAQAIIDEAKILEDAMLTALSEPRRSKEAEEVSLF